MRIFLTPLEAWAVKEALGYQIHYIRNSTATDPGKPARIAEAQAIQQSVTAKIRAATPKKAEGAKK